jgi:uncharacterized protein (DUF486 family)
VFAPFAVLYMREPLKLDYSCYGRDCACSEQCILLFRS